MEYIIRNCPKCRKELHIPIDLEQCICMYCGENFNIEEQEQTEEPQVDRKELEVAYQDALEQVGSLVGNYTKLLSGFTGESYRTSFQEYAQLGENILLPVNLYAKSSDSILNEVTGEVTEALLSAIEKNIEGSRGLLSGNTRAKIIDQHRYFLAVYLVPMLVHLELEISDALITQIMEGWKKRYPKCEFKKANYEELAAGFQRKGFCYITSAVCDTLNKPDDCYELVRLREFRDQYLMNSVDGKRLVDEYYNTAPRIVAYINLQTGSEMIYHQIWSKYLVPCLKDIESGHREKCKKRYVRMVRQLRSKLPVK